MANVLVVTYALNGLLMVLMPVVLAILLRRKFGFGWRLVGIGATTFVLSQVGHIPFNALLTWLFKQGILPSPPQNWRVVFNAIVLGLSAGLWEESARYAMYRWWAKTARGWRDAIMLGVGHGGIEALLLGLLVLLAYVNFSILRTADISTLVQPEQLAAVQAEVEAYWSVDWYASLLGAVERALTIPFHIAASVLVWQVFRRGQIRWLWLSIAWHAFVNAGVVVILNWTNVYATEGFALLTLPVNLWIIFHFKEAQPEDIEPIAAGQSTHPQDNSEPDFVLEQPEITRDQIEDTRYQ